MTIEPIAVETEAQAHERFLDRYYRVASPTYDLTRKYYLFGRDVVIERLLRERWTSLVEIGPGTGRNLALLKRGRRRARLGGIDASRAMLDVARRRCPWARLEHGLAESHDYRATLGRAPDRILFSYTLSMIPDPRRALAHARRMLAPDGEIVIVDFGPMDDLPRVARGAFRSWLRAFHVTPLDSEWLATEARTMELGPLGYYVIARVGALRGRSAPVADA